MNELIKYDWEETFEKVVSDLKFNVMDMTSEEVIIFFNYIIDGCFKRNFDTKRLKVISIVKSSHKKKKKRVILCYLMDYALSLLIIENKYTEVNYQDDVIKEFNNIFSEYEFVAKEYTIKSGRIDILAKCKSSNRPVIIELKLFDKNPAKQLFRYSKDFESPILVALTEDKVKHKVQGIVYKEYKVRGDQ